LHLFKGMSVIVEQPLVRLKQKSLCVQDQDMLRKKIYELPELPLVLPEFLLRALLLDGNSGNPAGVVDQLNFGGARLSNFTVKHTEGAQYFAVVGNDWRRPGGAHPRSLNKVFKGGKVRVGEHIRHKNGLSQVSRSATRSD